ncbi:MAG: type II toxin-antitoxin system death-on-curing family toxin [Candidatus Zhuqueibacterota bacterium]
MRLFYIDLEQAIQIHEKTIEISGGGVSGHLNIEQLDSVLTHIQNDDYYPSFIDKLTHLVFAVNRFHCFQDGNKRLSISLGIQFLNLNGYLYCINRFVQEMENLSYHVAAGRIDDALLRRVMESIIYERDFSEALKLEILSCMDDSNL